MRASAIRIGVLAAAATVGVIFHTRASAVRFSARAHCCCRLDSRYLILSNLFISADFLFAALDKTFSSRFRRFGMQTLQRLRVFLRLKGRRSLVSNCRRRRSSHFFAITPFERPSDAMTSLRGDASSADDKRARLITQRSSFDAHSWRAHLQTPTAAPFFFVLTHVRNVAAAAVVVAAARSLICRHCFCCRSPNERRSLVISCLRTLKKLI